MGVACLGARRLGGRRHGRLSAPLSGGSSTEKNGAAPSTEREPTAATSTTLPPRFLSAAVFQEGDWPLSVPGGVVECKGPNAVVFITPDGVVYAVNGTSRSFLKKDIDAGRVRLIDEIWLANPAVEG